MYGSLTAESDGSAFRMANMSRFTLLLFYIWAKTKVQSSKVHGTELSSVRFAPICVLFGKGDTKKVTRENSTSPHVQVLDKGVGVGSSTIWQVAPTKSYKTTETYLKIKF